MYSISTIAERAEVQLRSFWSKLEHGTLASTHAMKIKPCFPQFIDSGMLECNHSASGRVLAQKLCWLECTLYDPST